MKCIVKIANNAKTIRHAMNIINHITKSGRSAGKNPMSLAAAKTNESITKDSISHVAGITGVTLRNSLNDPKRYNLN
jgi:transcription initiation factor TFIIIB Brf1 subunit/transcription initiation factor TFIIB